MFGCTGNMMFIKRASTSQPKDLSSLPPRSRSVTGCCMHESSEVFVCMLALSLNETDRRGLVQFSWTNNICSNSLCWILGARETHRSVWSWPWGSNYGKKQHFHRAISKFIMERCNGKVNTSRSRRKNRRARRRKKRRQPVQQTFALQ